MGCTEQVSKFREKLLTTREASRILGVSESDIIEMTKRGKLPHYKVAGEFLRFKKGEVLNVKDDIQKKFNLKKHRITFGERVREFFYFNDFYIISGGIIVFLLWYIFKG